MATSGYRKEILQNAKDLHKRLLCCICNLILRGAVQSVCGHRYCECCVQDKLTKSTDEGTPARCPRCEEDSSDGILIKKQICPDFHARRELRNLSVRCCNENCKWEGKFQQYTEHEAECEFELIKCLKAGCGKSLRRADLAYHLEKDCPMRSVRCRNCGEEEVYKNIKKHNTECTKVPVACDYCNKKLPRDQLPFHQDQANGDCPKKPQFCLFEKFGCSFKVSGPGLKEHLQAEIVYHNQLLVKAFDDFLNSCKAKFETQGIIRAAESGTSDESEEGASATPNTSPSGFSLEHLVSLLKQWFVTHDEQNEGGANNSKGMKETKKAKSDNSSKAEAVTGDKIGYLVNKVKEVDKEFDNLKTLYAVLDKRNETFQEVVAVLNNQLEAVAEKANALERENKHLQEVINQQERQIHAHDQMLTVKNVALAEQELRIQTLESSAFNGILIWKITEYARRRREAVSGKTTSFYSHPFYTSYHGYKMRARIYLNGDGMGKGTHLSLFFVIMKGQYDNILHWPFRQKVTFMMVDQGNREHVVDAFRPDPTSSSFKKPTSEMNIASGCPLFVNLNQLQSDQYTYIKDDCLFVKVIVDVSDLERI
ncbi:TNF receptor-associated factor 3-like [Amphiura filiformis]|uniref:TNF receptor-associated factor 3-like n=1 Tax=Amphiura filiformis TaxID=82378 RepID=UPI003B2170F4